MHGAISRREYRAVVTALEVRLAGHPALQILGTVPRPGHRRHLQTARLNRRAFRVVHRRSGSVADDPRRRAAVDRTTDGWSTERFGRMSLDDLLEPA